MGSVSYRLPKISIIIPCFNHSRFIVGCLESLLHSYQGEIEVVLCDDCSSDGSYEIAQEAMRELFSKENGFTYFAMRNSENRGVCSTLNLLVQNATSDYVYLIASDDMAYPGGLTKAMLKMLGSRADAIISDCKVINDASELVNESAFFELRQANREMMQSGMLLPELVMNWTVPGPALLLRKSVYDLIGGYDEGLLVEDRDFYLRLLSRCRVEFNFEAVACYRIHDSNSFSNNKNRLKIHKELSLVNAAHSKRFSFPMNLYLYTFAIDTLLPEKILFIPKAIRAIIRFSYMRLMHKGM